MASSDDDRDVTDPRGPAGAPVPDPEVLAQLAVTLDAVDELVLVVDHRLVPTYLNGAARRFLGLAPAADPSTRSLLDLVPPGDRDEVAVTVLDAVAEADQWHGEVVLRRHDGVDVPCSQDVVVHRDAGGRLVRLSVVARDISIQRRLESRLEHEATHDAVTGLANRRLLVERIEQALSRSRRHGDEVVVCFVDLDRFASVNDRLGYAAGDELLRQVARRLRGVVRLEDVVGRFGGDEFVLLCEDVQPDVDPVAIAHRVVDAVSAPYELEAGEAVIEVSVGLVVTGAGAGSPDRLLRTADEAMYRAKGRGHNQVEMVRLPPGY